MDKYFNEAVYDEERDGSSWGDEERDESPWEDEECDDSSCKPKDEDGRSKGGPILIMDDGEIELKGPPRRGPKPREGVRHRIKITLTFWEGEDDELIELLRDAKSRSGIIYAALRGSNVMKPTGPVEEDFDDLFADLVL